VSLPVTSCSLSTSDSANIIEFCLLGYNIQQIRQEEVVSALVFRFFLYKSDFLEIFDFPEQILDLFRWEWIDLFQTDNQNGIIRIILLCSHQIHCHFSACNQYFPDFCLFVIRYDHFSEAAFQKRAYRFTDKLVPEQALRCHKNEWFHAFGTEILCLPSEKVEIIGAAGQIGNCHIVFSRQLKISLKPGR